MRIIAGTYRGISLTELGKGDASAQLRPTTDRVRESLFNVLTMGAHGRDLTGVRVLDLFAGTGALGLEALSRGAERVCFVENGRKGFTLISKNIAKLRAAEMCTVLKTDATRLPDCPYAPFDVVFLDPPYGRNMGGSALSRARDNGWLAQDALIIWEESAAQSPPDGFSLLDTRIYGDTHMTFLNHDFAHK